VIDTLPTLNALLDLVYGPVTEREVSAPFPGSTSATPTGCQVLLFRTAKTGPSSTER
jgi:hypothetical protein